MKRVYISTLTLIILSILIVSAGVIKTGSVKWQSSNEIQVNIDGSSRNLQDALNQGLLVNPSPSSIRSTDTVFSNNLGHNFEEILVSTNQGEMNLKEAISRADICGGSVISGEIDPGHSADEIEVTTSSGTKSLQEAINDKDVLYTDNVQTGLMRCSGDNSQVYSLDSCGRDTITSDALCPTHDSEIRKECEIRDRRWFPPRLYHVTYQDNYETGCEGSGTCFDRLRDTVQIDIDLCEAACAPWSSWTCSGNTKTRSRTCTAAQCSTSSGCFQTKYTDTESEDCGFDYTCSGGICFFQGN